MSGLQGRRAVVTGAGQGVGRGIALGLAGAGAELMVNDLVEERAAAVVEEAKREGIARFSEETGTFSTVEVT